MMQLNHDICYRAVQARDARFDGQFFTAVSSTGIYCRPICPATTPKPENCTFFACAAAAHEAGYRPCLRCRPEISPDLSASLGGSGIVTRALRLIAEGALDEGSVHELAAQLAVTERHLRRLFVEHLGAAPVVVAQTRRILFAKQLLDETALPISEVALAAGFGSIRRFNDVMQTTYGRAPRELRHGREEEPSGASPVGITLRLPFSPPYNWAALVRSLAPKMTAGVETVSAERYRRTIAVNGVHGTVEVRPAPGHNHLLATIRHPSVGALGGIVERLRRMFDVSANAAAIDGHLGADPILAPIVAAQPGLRVPGAWDNFELAVRTILGQQISVAAATTLAGRIAAAHGQPLSLDGGAPDEELRWVFPTPAALAEADLTALGVIRTRAAAIQGLARAALADSSLLDNSLSLEQAVERLVALPGIGPWTAHYFAMRGLREPDAFPASDLGLLKALGAPGQPMTPKRLEALAAAWRPWRSYATMYLWAML
jgi:AraC family transcriptional regulator of adaptative response / DNA-3-methyladenine glycosylase II